MQEPSATTPPTQSNHPLIPSPQPDPVLLLEAPRDLEIPHQPTSCQMALLETASCLCVSLSSAIHLPSEELMEVDVPNEDLVKEPTQMSENVKGKMKAMTLETKPLTVDPPFTTPIHNPALNLPPLSILPITEAATMPTGVGCAYQSTPSTQFMVGRVLTQLGQVMQQLLLKGSTQGYSRPLLLEAYMEDFYLHINDTMERESVRGPSVITPQGALFPTNCLSSLAIPFPDLLASCQASLSIPPSLSLWISTIPANTLE
ncbi:hypothetical protein BU17DRAFT_93987 [Hysterangium stoloniferum]|nr:hypothetical protein BU17DRAFT_93987 [Hysterangium stoloniferum]